MMKTFILAKLGLYKQIIFSLATIVFLPVTLIFQNQYKHEGDTMEKVSDK